MVALASEPLRVTLRLSKFKWRAVKRPNSHNNSYPMVVWWWRPLLVFIIYFIGVSYLNSFCVVRHFKNDQETGSSQLSPSSGTVTRDKEKMANNWQVRTQSVAYSAGVFFGCATVLLANAPCWNSKREDKMGRVKRRRVGGGEHLPSSYPKGYYFYSL